MANKRSSTRAFTKLYYRYKVDAKKKGLAFELSKEQFKLLTSNRCAYCHSEPYKSSNVNIKAIEDYIYNGIDRIRSDDGYIIGNVVSCCEICNYMKRRLTPTEFYDHIYKIYKAQEEYYKCRTESNAENV